MEDRYIYKAKRLDNGEWVEGYLSYPFCTKKGNESYYFYAKDSLGLFCRCVVDASTICQCTGLKDKNGKLIWENDVVKQFADCNELGNSLYFFYQIRWNNEYSAFEGYEIYTEETVLFPDLEDIEVIGNIFDNPELLEV